MSQFPIFQYLLNFWKWWLLLNKNIYNFWSLKNC
jgi:hypothetical protein